MASSDDFTSCSLLKRVGLKIYKLNVPIPILKKHRPINPHPALSKHCDCHCPQHSGSYWLRNHGRHFLKQTQLSISLCRFLCLSFFLELELPLTSKRIFLKVLRNRRAGSVVLPAAESAPDAFSGEQTGLNAPFQASLKILQPKAFHVLDL